jgi:CubicO group peptidase (beta-lactamase class C family)
VVAQAVVAGGGRATAGDVNTVEGFVAPGFEPVADVLAHGARATVRDRERVADLGAGGGAFAAYVDGECVVDVWAGWAAPGVPWAADTRAVIMSATKGLTTLCAHILHDRGRLDLDAPVAAYWPEWGAAGKEHTTVRQLLSHQAGAIGVPDADRLLGWDGTGWADPPAIAAAIAAAPPAWEPGTAHGYHGVTFGWLVGELVRRVSGVSLGTFFRTEVAARFDVACDIGTPAAQLGNVARVLEWGDPTSPASRPPLYPDSLAGRSVLAGARGDLFADEEGRPRFASFINQPAVLTAEMGSINATATAGALARVYAALAGGEELVSRPSVARFAAEQVRGRDAVMRIPTRWAVGYTRESPSAPGLPRQHGPNDAAFGHMGAGGQVGMADPEAGVACAFVRNHLERQDMPFLGAAAVDALYRSLARR